MRNRWLIGGIAAGLALGPAVAFARLLQDTPGLIIVAAIVPACCWAGLVLLTDRDDPEPPGALLAMFAWGAIVAALVSQTVNDGVYEWLATTRGSGVARSVTPRLLAPLIEEGLKAGGLVLLVLLWRPHVDGLRDGIVYGAMIGMGFAMTENLAYFLLATFQGGMPGLARAIYLRAILQGFNHAAFTATTGAAVGWACAADRAGPVTAGARAATASRWPAVVALGFTAAVAQHVAWNALGSHVVQSLLCGADVPGGTCQLTPSETSLFVTVPLVVAAFIGPGGLTLAAMGAIARRRA